MLQKFMYKNVCSNSKIIVITTLAMLISPQLLAEVSISANLLLSRTFAANIARELLMTPPVNDNNDNDWNGFFTITGVYQHSFNQNETEGIGAYPFWSGTNSMLAGTNNTTGTNFDVYQFGLGPVTSIPTNSTISLSPASYQAGSDIMFYVGAKKYERGIFFKVKTAITDLTIDPNLVEANSVIATPYTQGQLYNSTADVPNPATSMTQAFAGGSAQGNYRPLQFGLIDGKQSSGTHFDDTEITVGYNVLSTESHFLAIGARVSVPTGTKPECVYILEPVLGRGGYWGVGGYLAASVNCWEGSSGKNKLVFNFMGDILHLCTANVMRSYDLTTNGYGSKYLLIADYNNNTYQNSIQNLINVSTVMSESSFGVEGDAAISLSYITGGFSIDLGYNAWGRTKENVTPTGNLDAFRYAVLGRQGVGASTGGSPAATTLCQPTATISESSPQVNVADGIVVVDATSPSNRISGVSALNNVITGQYSAASSKIFTKVAYAWKDKDYCPYFGLFGEVEFSNISNNTTPHWSLALEFGVSL